MSIPTILAAFGKVIGSLIKVGSIATKAIKIPGSIASAVALKLGASAATAAKVGTIARLVTGVGTHIAVNKLTESTPKFISTPVRAITDIAIVRAI